VYIVHATYIHTYILTYTIPGTRVLQHNHCRVCHAHILHACKHTYIHYMGENSFANQTYTYTACIHPYIHTPHLGRKVFRKTDIHIYCMHAYIHTPAHIHHTWAESSFARLLSCLSCTYTACIRTYVHTPYLGRNFFRKTDIHRYCMHANIHTPAHIHHTWAESSFARLLLCLSCTYTMHTYTYTTPGQKVFSQDYCCVRHAHILGVILFGLHMYVCMEYALNEYIHTYIVHIHTTCIHQGDVVWPAYVCMYGICISLTCMLIHTHIHCTHTYHLYPYTSIDMYLISEYSQCAFV
jgi:hypothetical protein